MNDGRWVVHELEGNNGTARVTLPGRPDADRRKVTNCCCNSAAGNVPLEDELRDALRPAMRQVWKELKPRGIIDLVAEMRYLDQAAPTPLGGPRRAAQRNRVHRTAAFSFPAGKAAGGAGLSRRTGADRTFQGASMAP